ncbi:MAG: hypothetical protein GXX99_03420 [Clostridiales bacterium]|nr:hypothetical protein [Clostridiales bacterium]
MPMEKAKIINTEQTGHRPIEVMFNPPLLEMSSSNSYADLKTPSKSQENQQFIKKNNDSLTVRLFFDTTREGVGVNTAVDPIIDLARVPKNAKQPPRLVFAWGEFNFPCVITSIDHKYDYFDSAGRALRAELVVKFQRCEPEAAAQEAPSPKAQKAEKQVTVKAGENLSCFCVDPKDWRAVALLNGIDNPLLFNQNEMVGMSIELP